MCAAKSALRTKRALGPTCSRLLVAGSTPTTKKQNNLREVDFSSQSVADLGPGASSVVAQKAEERLLLEALRRLPLDYQIAIELHHFEGMTGPQIAEVLDAPEGTIRSRLRRAKIQLREMVEALSDSPEALHSTLTHLAQWAVHVRDGVDGLQGGT